MDDVRAHELQFTGSGEGVPGGESGGRKVSEEVSSMQVLLSLRG